MIALLGILVLSVAPQDSFNFFKVSTAAKQIEQALIYCQQLAQMKNQNCGIYFVANGTYTVYETSIGTPAQNPLTNQPWVINLSEDYERVHILNSGQIEFNTLGKPVIGGGSNIQIGDGENSKTLLVTANTGVVQ